MATVRTITVTDKNAIHRFEQVVVKADSPNELHEKTAAAYAKLRERYSPDNFYYFNLTRSDNT